MTDHHFLYYSLQVGLCLIGVFTHIAYILMKASDKFDNKKANFNEKRFVKKNKWDFIFYVLAGLVMLTVKSVVRSYVGIEEITDAGLSCLSGLLGSVIIEKLLNKGK